MDPVAKPVTIRSRQDRERLCEIIMDTDKLPDLYRVAASEPTRSTIQSDKMWAMLGEVQAHSPKLHGCAMTPDMWKVVFMKAAGEAVRFIPTLEGDNFIPYGGRSSKLSIKQMSAVIEMIYAWGAMNGVTFHDGQDKAA